MEVTFLPLAPPSESAAGRIRVCGIAGMVFRDASRSILPSDLEAMARAMVHRGPDDEGTLIQGSVGLAVRRLSIIDVNGGQQPIWNEARNMAVIQNGEIYNYLDLRAELVRRGHQFTTSSDTEAIVHLYEETGPADDLPGRLLGMFAFAVYDQARQILMLARDRVGKKPLFLYSDDTVLEFASEIQALFAPKLPLDRSLDAAGIGGYLEIQHVSGPGSIFRKVRQLPPGCLLILERTAAGWEERAERRYWEIPGQTAGAGKTWRSFSRAVDGCEALLRDAVRRRLASDVPVGAFLSGGVDSSLIVALMGREGNDRVRTFSIGFDDPAIDESEAAASVARSLGTDHRSIRMPTPSADDLLTILSPCDQPLADPAVVPTWYLSRLAREQVTVALSGEGADEVFGGYRWYRAGASPGLFSRREQEPLETRRALLSEPLRHALAVGGEGRAHNAYLAAKAACDVAGSIGRLQVVDFKTWMADDLLVKVDRLSMAHSLEVRCPYLDHRLVEAALPGPDRWKIRWGHRKALLRAVARRYLPRAVVMQRKHGFQVPIDSLLRTSLRELLHDLTAHTSIVRMEIFDPEGVATLLRNWESNPALTRTVWKVLCFQIWLHRQQSDRTVSPALSV